MSDHSQFSLKLSLLNDYQFLVDFGDMGQLQTDEPAPLGSGDGPNPSRLLGAAIANCLAASLLFAIRKFKEDPGTLTVDVSGEMERQNGRLRISSVKVNLHLGNESTAIPHIQRALAQFEDFCVVTQSVRQGIPIAVEVFDSKGQQLNLTSAE
ncbi:MAG: OsmC family protein [Gammaproteobacteria bacterium]|nr:OsmC family protein [Gammaproteobacteria bacterium]